MGDACFNSMCSTFYLILYFWWRSPNSNVGPAFYESLLWGFQVWIALQSVVIWHAGAVERLLHLPVGGGRLRWLAVSLVKPAWALLVAALAPLSTGLVPFQRNVIFELSKLFKS